MSTWTPRDFRGGQVSLIALAVGLGIVSVSVQAQTLPTNGTVVSGAATITQPSAGQMTVNQTTDRGVINWQSFSIGAGGAVTFQQPSASSATLNRVTGAMTSVIAGKLSANGQIFLINPNGIQITPTGTVRTGSFVASTLDIRTDDFMARNLTFNGSGASAGVTNQGSIEVVPGGTVALIGGRVVNDGSITADGGRVGLAAAERVVVDMQGDGFLQVSIPTADADRATALITHAGRIRANGGRVEMRAATSADVARNAINVPGTIEARTVARTAGGVVFGDAPAPADAVVTRGRVTIDGGAGGAVRVGGTVMASGTAAAPGGTVSITGTSVAMAGAIYVSGATGGAVSIAALEALNLTGTVEARGLAGAGGTVQYSAASMVAAATSITDVSATTFGGTITADGGVALTASGAWLANGGTSGGRIDLTADDVRITAAALSATGGDTGGLIRIGGAFQGGDLHDNSPELQATFVTRWADAPDLRNATETRVGGTTTIDVSGGNAGGTAVVWANGSTWMNGAVNAGGALSAGSVEISGKDNLAYVDLAKLTLGAGGQLLLDPRNIIIGSTGTTSANTGSNEYGDNPDDPGSTHTIAASSGTGSLTSILNTGADVTLSAINDISVTVGWSSNGPGSSKAGNLTLQAGRHVTFTSGVTINTDSGDLTIVANANNIADSTFGTGRRQPGAATIDMRGTTVNAGDGVVTLAMQGGSKGGQVAGNILAGTISADAISVTFTSTATGNLQLNGNMTTANEINLPDRNLVVGANVVLTSNTNGGGADPITWSGEATKSIAGLVGGETIRFVEGSTLTRIGVMDTANAARLVLAPSGTASRFYGDANTVITAPNVVSGSLRAGDTVDTLLVAGSTTVTWGSGGAPTATTSAGTTRTYTVSDNAGIAFAAGRRGYFLNPATASGTLTVARRPITVIADPKSKFYGDADPALTYQISSGNLVNGDTLTGSLSRQPGSGIGQYGINQNTLNNTNYNISYFISFLTISARPITVTADAKTKIYGDSDPALTYQITSGNLVSGDSLTGALNRAVGSNVGNYAINQNTLNNNNYAITYIGANLSITPAKLSVSALPATKFYGDADPGFAFSASGLKNGDNPSVVTGALSRAAGESVGAYAINQGTLSAGINYNISFTSANLTVNRAPLNVTAIAASKFYGDADPALTYSATGFKFTDTATTALTGALSRAPGETVAGGPYAINQGTLAGANYAITFTGANLTINRAPLNVSAVSASKFYGDADPLLTFSATGFKFTDTATTALTGALARAPGETVAGGPYAINQGTLAGANYAIAFTGANLTVNRAPLNVSATALSKTYGDADPLLAFSATGFKFTDSAATALTGALARAPGETVAGGPYAINQGTLAGANYSINFSGSVFTINRAPLNVTAIGASKIYGDADPVLTFGATGFKFTDSAATALTGALARAPGETVAGGAYAINQGTLAGANYAITFTGANFTINQRPVTVTADPKSKVYGDVDPTLTFTTGSLGSGAPINGSLTRAPGETVVGGPYAILQGSVTDANNPNYQITYVSAGLSVTARPVTVTADAKTKVYGDTDPALTFTTSSLGSGVAINGSLSRAPGETVAGGPYVILQGSVTDANNPNYQITYVGAGLSVTARPVTVTADTKTKVYGDADPALTFTTSSLGSGAAIVGSLTRAPGETVAGGPYAILQGTATDANNPNYQITYVGSNLSVTPRPITVAADSLTKVELLPDPAFTWHLTSGTIVFGDVPTGALTRDPGEAPGAYAITQGTFAFGKDYALTFVNGLLTITPRPTNPFPGIAGGTPGNGGNGVLAGLFSPSGGGSVRSGVFRDIDESGAVDTESARQTSPNCLINAAGTLICPQVSP